MALTDKLTEEKAELESYLDSARGAKLEQSQIDRLETLNNLLGINSNEGQGVGSATAENQTIVQANAGNNADKALTIQGIDNGKPISIQFTSTQPVNIENNIASETGGNLELLATEIGSVSSQAVNLSDLYLDNSLSADINSLLKTILLTNRQVVANTRAWTPLTLSGTGNAADPLQFFVPANTDYHFLLGNIQLQTNGSEGNRRVTISILNTDGSLIFPLYSAILQPENTTYNYPLASTDYPSIADLNAYPIKLPLSIILSEGQEIRIYVSGQQGGDEIQVHLQVGVR